MPVLNDADAIYVGDIAADAVYAGDADVWPSAPAAPSASLIVAYTPGSARNDFTGAVGVRLGIGAAPVTFTFVGVRCFATGDGGPRTVRLYEWFSGAVVLTATVDLTGKTAGEYAWSPVPAYTMAAGGYYALLMECTAGMQPWANPGPVTLAPSIVNIYDSYYAGGLQTGLQNSMFVGVDVGWVAP